MPECKVQWAAAANKLRAIVKMIFVFFSACLSARHWKIQICLRGCSLDGSGTQTRAGQARLCVVSGCAGCFSFFLSLCLSYLNEE